MQRKQLRSKTYKTVLDILEHECLTRDELIEAVYKSFSLTREEMQNNSPSSKKQSIRSSVGEALSVMEGNGIIQVCDDDRFKLITEKPVAIRMEKLEKEILTMLSKGNYTKNQIKERLVTLYATKKTKSTKDDAALYQYVSQILGRLKVEKTVRFIGDKISLCSDKLAKIDDRKEMLELKNVFLVKLHSKGGEFFEQYFVSLITRYLTLTGKKVTEAFVTAGSDDGGIDGIVKTEDILGFRETVMIQTKNRNVITNETDVRGFYGAVCAKRGTRGIYAISSTFHQNARKFLDSLDDCIGIDGDGIFDMALKTRYGITKSGGKFLIDTKIFN